jgi:signal transduction histidine kinase
MRGGGRLVLRCRDVSLHPSGQKAARISVADSGSGMDAETLKQIFEPFFSTKGIGGTGVGIMDNRGAPEEEWRLDPHPQQ